MRSLFVRIFVFFWLMMAAIFSLFVLTSERPRTIEAHHIWRTMIGGALLLNGHTLATLYDGQGCPQVISYAAQMARSTPVRIYLFDSQAHQLCAASAPAGAASLAEAALLTPEVQFSSVSEERLAGLRAPLESGRNYAVIAELPPRLAPPFRPWQAAQRLMIAVAVSGFACFLLARYLASPIGRLRSAAREIAAGNLKARAGGADDRGGGEVAGLVRDFDHMAERLGSLIEAQTRLVRDVSHELRSPLARLSVALELARRESSPQATAALDRMQRESERLNGLIERLLKLARLESGQPAASAQVIELADLVREAAADADFEAQSLGTRVECRSLENCRVQADAELLRSALDNVLRNAVHYSPKGRVVEVDLHCTQASGARQSVLQVRDHGPGIPEAELENIFRAFYRLDQSRERGTGGIGLGLAIAERSIRLNRGQIRATNADGGGLMIEIELPQA